MFARFIVFSGVGDDIIRDIDKMIYLVNAEIKDIYKVFHIILLSSFHQMDYCGIL